MFLVIRCRSRNREREERCSSLPLLRRSLRPMSRERPLLLHTPCLFCSDGASSPGRVLGKRGRNGSRRAPHERQSATCGKIATAGRGDEDLGGQGRLSTLPKVGQT